MTPSSLFVQVDACRSLTLCHSFLFSSLVAILVYCMLVALLRLSASLRYKAPSHLPPIGTAIRSQRYTLSTQPLTASTMLKQAVKNHHTATPVQPVPPRQQSLAKSLNRTQSSQKTPSARPLSTLSANGTKHNAAADRGLVGQIHGIKRTSSGLAKALGSQEEFDYPSLSISDIENEPLHSFRPAMRNSFAPQAPVAFDEDDFDSDIDLEVEDPSERSTVQYPTLPQTGTASRDSTYFSATTPAPDSKPMSDSSQPVPWSSSPPEHYQPLAASVDNAPAPPPTKRRTLPWQQGHNRYTASQLDKYSYDPESEAQTPRPTKRRATSAARNEQSTPAPKENKPAYSWNITQSALKQQQKSLREANKKAAKTSDSAEDVTGGIFKRKETIARIFLTEEQQHVLNLVVEHKKSVFFTGSAGRLSTQLTL